MNDKIVHATIVIKSNTNNMKEKNHKIILLLFD